MLSVSVRVAPCPDAAPCVDATPAVVAGRFDLARPTSDISPLRYRHPNLTATRPRKRPSFPVLRNQSPDASQELPLLGRQPDIMLSPQITYPRPFPPRLSPLQSRKSKLERACS